MAEIHVVKPNSIDQDGWRRLQGLSRVAFGESLNHSFSEIDALVEWNNPSAYYFSHVDPNEQVGHRFHENQSFKHARVAIATEGDYPIGFAYGARNVSGASAASRLRKRMSLTHNYFWMREIAVHPDCRHHGIGKRLGRALLHEAISVQPVSAYVWPEEIPWLQDKLEHLGFFTTGSELVRPFGPGTARTRQVRMQAPSARTVDIALTWSGKR